MTTTRALVLDFGQVVTRSIFEIAAHVERGFGLRPGTLAWRGPLAVETDLLWADMLAGRLTEREYWARRVEQIGAMAGRPLDMRAFTSCAYGAAGDDAFRPEVESLVLDARAAGLKIGILTNELELFHDRAFLERVPIRAHVDAVVDATHTNILKPDPRAYALVADALGVAAPECLFVDDQPRNVAGARAAGMPAIEFDILDVPASVAKIRASLDLPHSALENRAAS